MTAAVDQILGAFALLNSMIECGEKHSDTSRQQVEAAKDAARKLQCEGACEDRSCEMRSGHTGMHEDPAGRQWDQWPFRPVSDPARPKVGSCRNCDHKTEGDGDRMPMSCERCGATTITVRL